MEQLDELHEGVSQSLSTTQSRETTAQQRRATALRVGSLAAAGHHAAGDLEEHFPQIARCVHDAAAGFEHISSFCATPTSMKWPTSSAIWVASSPPRWLQGSF